MKNKLFLFLGGISLAYILDVFVREKLASRQARNLANNLGKPLLNVGSGTDYSSFTGAKLTGNINCDIAAPRNAACAPGQVCFCDVQDLRQFKNKQFGVALAVNILRYVPDKQKAIQELNRVADHVIISNNFLPWPQLGPGPVFPV